MQTSYEPSDLDAHKVNKKHEKGRFLGSLVFPVAFVLFLWAIKASELFFGFSLAGLGLVPLKITGLPGILLAPFIHGSVTHLASNSLPLIVLGTALFYFYKPVAWKVVIMGVLITGLWVWIIARPSFHIGASGIIYSLASFLFVSGVIRRHPRLMALSLLVAFLYGGLVWGIFPVREGVSWESHLMGLLSGFVLAIFYQKHGPQRPRYSWEEEEEEESDKVDGEDGLAPAGDEPINHQDRTIDSPYWFRSISR